MGNDQAVCAAMHLLLIFAAFPSTTEPASFAMLKQERKEKHAQCSSETHKHSAKGKLSKATVV